MKKRKILSLLVALSMVITMIPHAAFATTANLADNLEINEINFPDQYFREYIATNFDKDNDNYLSKDEISNITELEIDEDFFEDLNIADTIAPMDDDDDDEDDSLIGVPIDLKGLEFFTELVELSIENLEILNLDLSQNTKLEFLEIEGNIDSIDLSNLANLVELDLEDNYLTNIDLSNNPALTYLDLEDNQLESLNLSNNPSLRILDCSENLLTKLDLSNNLNLVELDCSDNQLTELNLLKNTKLEELDFKDNKFKEPIVEDSTIIKNNGPVSPDRDLIVTPDVTNPSTPLVPDNGATIGMTSQQKRETAKKMVDLLEDILDSLEDATEDPKEYEKAIADAIKLGQQIDFNVIANAFDEEDALSDIQEDIDEIKSNLTEIFGPEGQEIIQYIDININAINNGKSLGNVTDMPKKIPFTVQLPRDAKGNYGIARVHNGVFEKLPASDVIFNPTNQKITFYTNRFSTYAVYAYEKDPTVEPEKPIVPETKPSNTVKNLSVTTDYGLAKVQFHKTPNAKSYKIMYRALPKKGVKSRWTTVVTSKTSYLISRLDKNTCYEFKVAPIDKTTNKLGKYTKSVRKYSNLNGLRATKMYSPKFNFIDRDDDDLFIRVSPVAYKKVPSPIKYKYTIQKVGSKNVKTVTSLQPFHKFKGLRANTKYKLSISYSYKSPLDNSKTVTSKVVSKIIRTEKY